MANILTDIQDITITSIEVKPLAIPSLTPFSNHVRLINKIDAIACWVHTNKGISGQGLVYGLGAIDHATVIDYVNKIINKQLVTPKQVNQTMLDAKLPISFELHNAISMIDIAIWDIYLKEKNIPLQFLVTHEQTFQH